MKRKVRMLEVDVAFFFAAAASAVDVDIVVGVVGIIISFSYLQWMQEMCRIWFIIK